MDYRRNFPPQSEEIRGYRVNLAPSLAVRKSLELFSLEQWGFVILRCTYSSQEKSDQFMAELKEHAQDYLEAREMKDVGDAITWTVIEDAENLDGANASKAALNFEEWRKKEGSPEMRKKDVDSKISGCPRYDYFIHGNKTSVESVVDDAIARKKKGYYFTLISFWGIMEKDDEEDEGQDEDEEEEASSERNEVDAFLDNIYVEKRFKADDIVGVYAELLELDNWYEMTVLESLVT